MRIEDLKQAAAGRWPGIVSALGIDVGTGKHIHCPICRSEKKWFRFDDKNGDGTWICNHCGAGDGLSLIQKACGIDFKDAMEEVSRLCNVVKRGKILKDKGIKPEVLRKIYMQSQKMTTEDPAGVYLKSRKIKLVPDTLRYTAKCWNSEVKKEIPAMLAVVTSPKGKALTMHRTFLTLDGRKAEVEKPKRLLPALKDGTEDDESPLRGAAIRLFEPVQGCIGLAEGIETALACYELFGYPTWATVSSTLMETWEPPKGIKEVVIYGDNDKNYAGQKAAYTLAFRLSVKNKIPVDVKFPDTPGTDFADVLITTYP